MVRDILVSETLVEEIMKKSAASAGNMKSECIDLVSPGLRTNTITKFFGAIKKVGDAVEACGNVTVAANDDGANAKSPRKTVFTDLEYSPQSFEKKKKKTMEEENKEKAAVELHGMGKVVNNTGYI